jgi:hypothetical protein
MNDQNQSSLLINDPSNSSKSYVIKVVVIALMGLISLCLFGFGLLMTVNPALSAQIIATATGDALTVGEGFLASSLCCFGPAVLLLIACGIVYLSLVRSN